MDEMLTTQKRESYQGLVLTELSVSDRGPKQLKMEEKGYQCVRDCERTHMQPPNIEMHTMV